MLPTDVMKNSYKIIIEKCQFPEAEEADLFFFSLYESSGLYVTGSRIVYKCICALKKKKKKKKKKPWENINFSTP